MAKGGGEKTEFEIKLVGAPADIAALRDSPLIAALARSRSKTARLVSTYYDTADGALAAAQLTLRMREGAGRQMQTLKRQTGAGALARYEEETEFKIGDTFPKPVRDKKAAKLLAAASGFQPVARIVVDRTTLTLEKHGTRIKAAFDFGRLEAWKRGRPMRVGPLSEAELELVDGDPADIFELAAAIVEECGGRLRPGVLSKAAQAHRLSNGANIPPEKSVQLVNKHDACDALAASLSAAAVRIIEVAPAVVELRLPEGVHQLRIALRRFRTLEQTYRKGLKTNTLRALARRAREFASALGPARDWDVFVEDTLPLLSASASADDFAALRARAETLRATAWDRAALTIAAPAFHRFVLELLEAGHIQTWRAAARRPLHESARSFAAAALDARLVEACEAARNIDSPDPAARHPLRIALKKLRYTAQAFRSLYPQAARKEYLAALSRLQDDLGAVNDAVTAQRLANEAAIGQGKKAVRASGFIAGYLAAEGAARAQAAGEDWSALADAAPFWRDKQQ